MKFSFQKREAPPNYMNELFLLHWQLKHNNNSETEF